MNENYNVLSAAILMKHKNALKGRGLFIIQIQLPTWNYITRTCVHDIMILDLRDLC